MRGETRGRRLLHECTVCRAVKDDDNGAGAANASVRGVSAGGFIVIIGPEVVDKVISEVSEDSIQYEGMLISELSVGQLRTAKGAIPPCIFTVHVWQTDSGCLCRTKFRLRVLAPRFLGLSARIWSGRYRQGLE